MPRSRFVVSILLMLVMAFLAKPSSAKVLRIYHGKLNINTASAADFARLPGIGGVLSFHMVKERERLGKFSSITELSNVKGISPRIYSGIKNYVSLNGENDLQVLIDLNTVTRPVLLGLPGMSSTQARSIINYRKARPFRSVEDLLLVPGIDRKRKQELAEWLTVVEKQIR